MKIKKQQDPSFSDIEITLRYAMEDGKVKRILSFLQSIDMQIKCDINNTEKMISAADIYYIESVDKKTFVYLEKSVYHTERRLYQLIDDLRDYGFVQISKSCLLNIHVLDSIKPLFNSRMEALLKNGEKVSVNRGYLSQVKEALRGDEGL